MAFPFIYILGIAHALTREQKKIRKNVAIEVDQDNELVIVTLRFKKRYLNFTLMSFFHCCPRSLYKRLWYKLQ